MKVMTCGSSQALSVYFRVYILICQGIRSLFCKKGSIGHQIQGPCLLFVFEEVGGGTPTACTYNPSSLVVGAGKLGVGLS